MEASKVQLEHVVTQEENKQRLDILLSQKFPEYTRSFFTRLISDSYVLVNNVIQTKSGIKVKELDQIIVNIPQKSVESVYAQATPDDEKRDFSSISVIFEHEHFLIINKAAGILTHQAHKMDTRFTLIDWLLIHYPELKNIGYEGRPGIVHRLDKNTSGIMIIPRTSFAHAFFIDAFFSRTIKKTYKAIVCGITPKEGVIDFKIGMDQQNRLRKKAYKNDMLPPEHIKLRDAKTEYKIVSYFKEHTLLSLHPVTGRTHQLRVHCAAIGHPILGDISYGTASDLISRQALHAFSLSFNFEHQDYYFESPLPEDMQKIISILSDGSSD